MEYLILIFAFLAVILIVVGLLSTLFSKRTEIKSRLDLYTTDDEKFSDQQDVSLKEFLIGITTSLTKGASRKSSLERKRNKLRHAYVLMRPEEFISLQFLGGILLAGLFYLLSRNILIAILFFIVGYKLPDLYLSSLKKKRMIQLNTQLPEALNIISNGLRAGFSFGQAMASASSELESPIKDEFQKIVRDNSIGKTMDEALTDFTKRTDDEDIDMFVSALLIQRKVGGNLTEVLDTISATIRDRMRIRGEIRTLTAQGKFSAIIISLLPIFVALMIFIINREYIMELFSTTIGIIMVILAVFMQGIGIFIMTRLVDIEV